MPTSRKETGNEGGVAGRAERACRQTPAMEEGTGVNSGCTPGCSVLNSPSLRSLVGGECLQILRCGICMEFFNIPIVLPCGHTFCLQCLTEMCKHATCPRSPNPIATEVLIGCPNCRVQIFAMPILQRNVTCNFIIQSLLDMLRNRKVPLKRDVSINTERSLIGPRVRAISEEALCGVIHDLDRLSASLEHRSVVDDAFFEIENIRRQHLSSLDKASGDSLDEHTDSTGFRTDSVCCTRDASSSTDSPSDSSTTAKTDFTKILPNHNLNCQSSQRCYAAALTSGKDRSTATTTPSNGYSCTGNARETRPSCNPNKTLPVQTNVRTLPVPSLQNGKNISTGVRNKNRNNSENFYDIGSQDVVLETEQAQCTNYYMFRAGSKRKHFFQQDLMFMANESESIPAKVTNLQTGTVVCIVSRTYNKEDNLFQSPPKLARTALHSPKRTVSSYDIGSLRKCAKASLRTTLCSPKHTVSSYDISHSKKFAKTFMGTTLCSPKHNLEL